MESNCSQLAAVFCIIFSITVAADLSCRNDNINRVDSALNIEIYVRFCYNKTQRCLCWVYMADELLGITKLCHWQGFYCFLQEENEYGGQLQKTLETPY